MIDPSNKYWLFTGYPTQIPSQGDYATWRARVGAVLGGPPEGWQGGAPFYQRDWAVFAATLDLPIFAELFVALPRSVDAGSLPALTWGATPIHCVVTEDLANATRAAGRRHLLEVPEGAEATWLADRAQAWLEDFAGTRQPARLVEGVTLQALLAIRRAEDAGLPLWKL